MRPVNLLPLEDRRGDAAPTRTGALSYVLVGALAVVLLAVTGTVLAGKDVESKKIEAAALEQQASEAEARAASLASFSQFQSLKDAREQTIATLATSRFDWERVMRELSKVLPSHVWLVNLTGKASPEVTVTDEASISLRGTVPGYALELVGCARSQQDVAALISAMGDIDGVTRVTAAKSEKPDNEIAEVSGEGDTSTKDCRTRDYITQFELVAAFDSPSAPQGAGVAPDAGGLLPPPAVDGGVEDVQQARADGSEEVAAAEDDARQAASAVPGGGG